MTTVKISELPPATGALSSTDVVAAVQGGTTVKATVASFGYQPAGTGAVATTVQAKLRQVVSINDFGAVGNGTTNDSSAIQAAIDSLGAAGGTVTIPNGMKCLLDTGLNIKPNVTLQGPNLYVGSPANNASAPYGSLGGSLILNSATTITMYGGACLTGVLIYRKGMTFPAADASAFAGVAITAVNDDVHVQNSMILGFNKAFYSTGVQRPRLTNVYMDNVNGIEINSCYDIAYLTDCHCWPFATIASGGTLIRTGTAYLFTNGGDWNKITNCFSYGYFRGLFIGACNSITALGCGFDNVPGGHPNSIGVVVQGACQDIRLIGCQTAAHATAGIYINVDVSPDLITTITDHNIWGSSTHGILIDGGDAIITGCGFRDLTNCVTATSATSDIVFETNWSQNISGLIINATVSTTKINVGANNNFTNFVGDPTNNLTLAAIASAGAISVPNTASAFYITGTVNIGTVFYPWAGRVITLIFTNSLTVLNSSANPGTMRLNGSVNFNVVAGSTLTLLGIGGEVWAEIGRSV
jgi:hypothetical protein